TCHRRGAFAMGGMAAVIPNRREPEVTAQAFEKVRADKTREANDGFDGSWVAHPDLVPVARAVFDVVLGEQPNQLRRQRTDVVPDDRALIDLTGTQGLITEAGIRTNLEVGVRYLEAWLRGNGAVTLKNLMEDAATAEISRSQIWQWIHVHAVTDDGEIVTREWVSELLEEEFERLPRFDDDRFDDARQLFEEVALGEDFPEFLTLPAYTRHLC
ncbi:MAG: malate synthase A, partial [Actinomycetes bacterium]